MCLKGPLRVVGAPGALLSVADLAARLCGLQLQLRGLRGLLGPEAGLELVGKHRLLQELPLQGYDLALRISRLGAQQRQRDRVRGAGRASGRDRLEPGQLPRGEQALLLLDLRGAAADVVDTMMKQGHRFALLYRQWKIVKKQYQSGKMKIHLLRSKLRI